MQTPQYIHVHTYMDLYVRLNTHISTSETAMSSRRLFIPVGMKSSHTLSFATTVEELPIDTSLDVFGLPANACFVLLDYRVSAVGNPQAYTMQHQTHVMTCPPCSPSKDRQLWCAQMCLEEAAAMWIMYLISSFSRRSHVDWLIVV